MKPGLYANIHAKKARIAAGSGEKMRKPGAKGAPTAKAFRDSAKTAKPVKPVAKMKPVQVISTTVRERTTPPKRK